MDGNDHALRVAPVVPHQRESAQYAEELTGDEYTKSSTILKPLNDE